MNTLIPENNNFDFLKSEEKEFKTFYKRSSWWLGHRAKLRNLGFLLFIIFDLFLLLFVAWFFLDTYFISFNREQLDIAKVAVVGQSDLRSFSQNLAAKPLNIGDATIISNSEGKYDFYATVANYNQQWYATFDYKFITANGETKTENSFILPNEEKPFISLALAATNRPTGVSIELSNVKWQRIDAHQITNYPEWFSEHLNFKIENTTFVKETISGTSQESAQLAFDVTNSSAYGFRNPTFVVVLWRGGTVGGVMQLSTTNLESKEKKHLTARWLGLVPAVSKIEVFPQINLFDSTVYLEPKGATQLNKN